MNKCYLSMTLCFLVISCSPTPSESGIHKFLDAFYNESVDESLNYVDVDTEQWLRKYYLTKLDKSVCGVSNIRFSQKYEYQVITKKEDDGLKYFDIVFKGDTIEDMIVHKNKQSVLVKLDEHQFRKLLKIEKAAYTAILCVIINNLETFNQGNKINVAKDWFDESFHQKFEDSHINYLYGSFFEEIIAFEENEALIRKYASKSIAYYRKAYNQGYSGKGIFPKSNLGIFRRLSVLYTIINQYETFKIFCEEEAKKGNAEAISMLGEIYLNQYYNTKNIESIDRAIILFEEAAQKENKAAIINLYNIYNGLKKDPEKAAYWKSKIQY